MTTIDEALGIEVRMRRAVPRQFEADATKLPGSPPIGRGSSEAEAKFDLLAKLAWDRVYTRPTYAAIVDRLLRAAWNEQCSVRREAAPGIRVTAADDQRPQAAE